MKIYGVVLTNRFTDAAFFLFEVKAIFMDIGNQRDRLGKIYVHGLIGRQVLIVGIRDLHRAILDTDRTTCAVVLYNVPGLFVQRDRKISSNPFDPVNFSIRQYLYVGMPADLDQFG
jgi:hypothetical protein